MRPGAAVAIASLVLTLTSCAVDQATAGPPTVTASTKPTERESRFLAALTSIDPHLSVKPDRALRRASNVCGELSAGKPEQTVIDNARQRFSDDVLTLTEEQARQIVDAARVNVC